MNKNNKQMRQQIINCDDVCNTISMLNNKEQHRKWFKYRSHTEGGAEV